MGLKTSIIAAVALAAAVALGAAPAQASALFNGSFEDILTDWTADPSLVQTPGVFQHRDSNGDPDRQYDPVDGFILGAIQAGGGDFEVLLRQTFTTVGGLFSGSAAFLAEDDLTYNDYGFVRIIHDGDVLELFHADIAAVGAFGYTDWTGFSTVLGAGTYTIEAGVANAIDEFNPSFLLVDNFHLAEVPEPATWALLLAGFFGLGAALRRRRAIAA
jgi:hypothetical protein